MTAIVGIEDGGLVWVGADSSATNGHTTESLRHSKVWRSGPYIIGVAGSGRVSDVVQYGTKLTPPPDRGVRRHLVTVVVPAVQKALRKSKAMMTGSGGGTGEPSGGEAVPALFLLAIGAHLFSIDEEFCVSQVRDGYAAIGSGGAVACGALYASTGMAVKKRLALALNASAHHACGVRGPFVTMRTRAAWRLTPPQPLVTTPSPPATAARAPLRQR